MFFSCMIAKYCYNSVHYLVLCDEYVAILMIYTVISSAVGQLIYSTFLLILLLGYK